MQFLKMSCTFQLPKVQLISFSWPHENGPALRRKTILLTPPQKGPRVRCWLCQNRMLCQTRFRPDSPHKSRISKKPDVLCFPMPQYVKRNAPREGKQAKKERLRSVSPEAIFISLTRGLRAYPRCVYTARWGIPGWQLPGRSRPLSPRRLPCASECTGSPRSSAPGASGR